MKYITYKLHWTDNGQGSLMGEQPYQDVGDSGVIFNGGLAMKDNVYLGTLDGSSKICNQFIDICKEKYSMKEITKDEFDNFVPKVASLEERVTTLEQDSLDIKRKMKL
jgi:hypothetical protein